MSTGRQYLFPLGVLAIAGLFMLLASGANEPHDHSATLNAELSQQWGAKLKAEGVTKVEVYYPKDVVDVDHPGNDRLLSVNASIDSAGGDHNFHIDTSRGQTKGNLAPRFILTVKSRAPDDRVISVAFDDQARSAMSYLDMTAYISGSVQQVLQQTHEFNIQHANEQRVGAEHRATWQ